MRNLISFSPPTHSIIHSSTSVLLVLSHSYNFSLSPPSSIKWLFSLTFLKNSKWGTVGFDIFCSLKLSTPYPLWYFPLTKDHFEMTSPLSFISSTHHSSFPTAVWIISTPCPRLLRHCSVKPSFKSQQKTKRWQKGKVLNQTVDLHGVLLTFFSDACLLSTLLTHPIAELHLVLPFENELWLVSLQVFITSSRTPVDHYPCLQGQPGLKRRVREMWGPAQK